ncbi:hypothetical protein [Gymnodinialimonas sp. 57CJ19]|uniref:hypothetical protein n=1 Tax=Gymnodinialimonas sp. 57CJ19 TaxID=3138498 RepID=UPI0031342E33
MHRRTLLSAFASLPLLSVPMIAGAQEGRLVQVTASQEGARATITQQGENRFLLEVTRLGFNIGMPPSSRFNIGMPPAERLQGFDGRSVMGQEVTVSVGSNTAWIIIESMTFGDFGSGGARGRLEIEVNGRTAGLGFLLPVASAAAALGADAMGRGGEGRLSMGGTQLGFLLENVG